jgi:hypothetical protein
MTVTQFDESAKYLTLYTGMSFEKNLPLLRYVKECEPRVQIPYMDVVHLRDDFRDLFDSYLYVEVDDKGSPLVDLGKVYKFLKVEITRLGLVRGKELNQMLAQCFTQTQKTLELGKYYRVGTGQGVGLIVRADSFQGDFVQCTYKGLTKLERVQVHQQELSVLEVEIDVDTLDKIFVELDQVYKEALSLRGDLDKVVIVDGSYLFLRAILLHSTLYATESNKFVGGSFGFYFTIVYLKTLLFDYDLVFVFDESVVKSAMAKYAVDVQEMSLCNLEWVYRFIDAIGYTRVSVEQGARAQDVISSLAVCFAKVKQSVLIYAIDYNYYSVLQDKVTMLVPKSGYRDHSRFVTKATVLKEYRVSSLEKVVWLRSVTGEVQTCVHRLEGFGMATGVSAFKYERQSTQWRTRVRHADYIHIINKSDCTTLERVKRWLQDFDYFEEFVKSGQFEENVRNFSVRTDLYAGDKEPAWITQPLNREFNSEKALSLLEENAFYKEIENWFRVEGVLLGYTLKSMAR